MANRQYPYVKTAAPTVNDDTGDGYKIGDTWLDTTKDRIYQVIDVTDGAAVWVNMADYRKMSGEYQLSVTVSANDLVLALLTPDGNTPSADEPVYVKIGTTVRKISSALSVTAADGTNWAALGGAFATLEQDLFAYLGYNATDGVVIGWSRNPAGRLYSDFSTTSTNENFCKISTITNAAAGDNYINIGRFAATLSAGAGYTWTVPTFTNLNLIQEPCYETRWLTYTPTWGGFSANPTDITARYKRVGRVTYCLLGAATSGTSNATTFTLTLPVLSVSTLYVTCPVIDNGTDQAAGFLKITAATLTADVYKSAFAAFTNANGKRMNIVQFFYDN